MSGDSASRADRVKPTADRHARSEVSHAVQPKLSLFFEARRRSLATVTVAVLIAVVLLAGGGTVYAATGALPGDALYPLKTTVEDVRLAVSLSGARDAELRLTFAARRLEEAATLLEKNRPEDVGQALANYTVQIESALASFQEDSPLLPDEQAALANQMAVDLARHRARLTALLNQVPGAARPAVELAVATSGAALDRALDVAGRPPRETPEPLPTPEHTPTSTPSPEALTPTPPPELLTPTSQPEQPVPTSRPEQPTPTPSPEPPAPTATTEPPSPTPSPELPTPGLPPGVADAGAAAGAGARGTDTGASTGVADTRAAVERQVTAPCLVNHQAQTGKPGDVGD
jgi:hypothetical protein